MRHVHALNTRRGGAAGTGQARDTACKLLYLLVLVASGGRPVGCSDFGLTNFNARTRYWALLISTHHGAFNKPKCTDSVSPPPRVAHLAALTSDSTDNLDATWAYDVQANTLRVPPRES